MLVDLQETEQTRTLEIASAVSLDRQCFGSSGRAAAMAVLGESNESLAVSADLARITMSLLDVGRKLEDAVAPALLDTRLGESLFPAFIDLRCLEIETPECGYLETRMRIAFEDDPLEDGIEHEAERIVDDVLRSMDEPQVLVWFRDRAVDRTDPGFASSVLRCLGRRRPGTSAWRAGIVQAALAADDVEMRDAAMQAAESWGGQEVRNVLRNHVESTPWLREYLEDIVQDLEE